MMLVLRRGADEEEIKRLVKHIEAYGADICLVEGVYDDAYTSR